MKIEKSVYYSVPDNKNLLNEVDWVGIGSKKHGEKDVVELEFWFELAEKLRK